MMLVQSGMSSKLHNSIDVVQLLRSTWNFFLVSVTFSLILG
jgi:hypothetical protein